MTASWLKQMGWQDVAVLVANEADGDWAYGPHRPRVLGLDVAKASAIGLQDLRARLDAGEATVVDLDLSTRYAKGAHSRRLPRGARAPRRCAGKTSRRRRRSC